MKWLYKQPLLARKMRKKRDQGARFIPLSEKNFINRTNRLVNIAYFVLNLTKTVFNSFVLCLTMKMSTKKH